MKQTRELDLVQQEMRPGVITQDGFLGTDTRQLVEILTDDEAAVQRLGLTHARIADRMRELRQAGRRGLGLAVSVPPCFEVTVDGVRGRLPCPFHGGTLPKINTTVVNTRLKESVTYTDLHIHMIARHGFYEGRGSPYRLDPARLAEALEIPREE